MTHIESVAMIAPETFGRDGAMFESLLGFVGQLSVVLWSLVMLTAVFRSVSIRLYRRGAARKARVETAAPSGAVGTAGVPTTSAEKDVVLVPAEFVTKATFDEVLLRAGSPVSVAASVKVPHRAHRHRRAEPRSASHVPALAANSTKS